MHDPKNAGKRKEEGRQGEKKKEKRGRKSSQ